jgi:hypothetical protein
MSDKKIVVAQSAMPIRDLPRPSYDYQCDKARSVTVSTPKEPTGDGQIKSLRNLCL